MSEETCVQVALRIRPLVSSEISRGCEQCIEKVLDEPQVHVRGDRLFTYNYVFDSKDNQGFIYDSAVKDLVSRLFKGYNVTILAYGQTGSGKTYSMGTCYSGDGDAGIIPRAIKDIFDIVVAKKEDWEFKITVSFMELYQEQLFDLLAENRCSVDLREENKEIRVPNLTEINVSSPEETTRCLVQGSTGRATGATAMNSQSSRSHAIFTITIHQQNLLDENCAMTAKFHLVDLAGSERSKKTLATGERFREGVNINRGLLALGNVISALGEESQKSYISYRDSKLTRLLQDSLGGNSLTLMIACVSPADYNLEETISTLRYADRARRIKNKPIVNQDRRAAELVRYKQQVKQLQLELLAYKSSGSACSPEHVNLVEENNFLVSKIRKLTEALTNALVESASLSEVALTAEQSRNRIKLKLFELRADFSQTMEILNVASNQNLLPPEILDALQQLNKHKETIQDLEADQKHSCEEIQKKVLSDTSSFNIKMENSNDSMGIAADIDQRHEEHTTQQQELNNELQELNRALALKEELASEMARTSNHLKGIQPASESTMKEFQEQIESLQKEKEQLLNELKSIHQQSNSSKVAEQRRKRLQELEHKIADLNRKVTEQAKIIKVNEQNDKKIIKLNEDIQSMKQTKVRLVRQMRSENERFREWQLERKREICKLKDQDRRRQNQMVRMERLHTKQQNVLKRKWEHAAAANKRLMDALAVQKSVQERRLNQGQGSLLNRVQTWLSQEVEVVVSRFEATRTLDHLLEDRAMLHDQRTVLQSNLEENYLTDLEVRDLNNEIKQLTEDLEIRNMQIEDLQQKLMTTDQDNKYKVKWDCLQSMAEAKFALKYLFDLATEAKREVSTKDYKLEELQDAHRQAVSKLEQYEQQLREVSREHQQELLCVEKEHQDKVLVLLRQLRGVQVQPEGGSHLADRLNILNQELEKMDSLKEELEKRDAEIATLKNQLTASVVKGGRPSLFPVAVPLQNSKPKKIPMKVTRLSMELSEVEDEDDDPEKDPDWQKTPIFKRIQKMKGRLEDKDDTRQAVKRTSDGQAKCVCKGLCRNRHCGCRKAGSACGQDCKCDQAVCTNQENYCTNINDPENATTSSEENRSAEESFKRPRTRPFEESNGQTQDNSAGVRMMMNYQPSGKFFQD